MGHGLWLLVLAKLITLPFVSLEYQWLPTEPTPVQPSQLGTSSNAGPLLEVLSSTETQPADGAELNREPTPVRAIEMFCGMGLPIVWVLGTVAVLVVNVLQIRRVRRLLRLTEPAADELARLSREIGELVGLRRPPVVRVLDACTSPMVWAIGWRPVVLLPRPLIDSLTTSQRQMLVAHELAHLRRGDHLVRWFELFVLAVCWWHPLAWFARRGLRQAEDECCDAWVAVLFPGQSQEYAEAIVTSLDFVSTGCIMLPSLASGFVGKRPLHRRLEMIVREKLSRRFARPAKLAVLFLALTVLPVCAQISDDADPEPASLSSRGAATSEETADGTSGGQASASDATLDAAESFASDSFAVSTQSKKQSTRSLE